MGGAMTQAVLLQTELLGCPAPRRGKVRDIYDAGEHLLLVATDRISVFDVVLPTGIPDKGVILTRISKFWFERMQDIVPNHLVSTDASRFPEPFRQHAAVLEGRSMLVKKATPLPVECIVRGYLAGSGWEEYRREGTVCGVRLPGGLQESSRLEAPVFTPSTKATSGHDQNIPFEQMVTLLGDARLAGRLRELSLAIYQRARSLAEARGVVIADTKFEFGRHGGDLILIDELLTPDSSRFWPKAGYEPGRSQPSFDKQFVRDYAAGLGWNKQPPGPALPPDIVASTREKYREALRLLTAGACCD